MESRKIDKHFYIGVIQHITVDKACRMRETHLMLVLVTCVPHCYTSFHPVMHLSTIRQVILYINLTAMLKVWHIL